MKKLLFFFLIVSQFSFAQNDIIFKINHLIGEDAFNATTTSTNNLDNELKFSRAQYYISKIEITHDGNTTTTIDNTWLLINAFDVTEINLGSYDITDLESVRFNIGVEQSFNHLDPSLYDVVHPLSPKSPSMHWGWSGGYRFIAIEGTSYGNVFELHIVGDSNYKQVSLDFIDTQAENNVLTIEINADYNQAFKDIDVSSGFALHSDAGSDVKKGVANFQNNIFSAKGDTTSDSNPDPTTINDIDKNMFKVFPNPTKGSIYLEGVDFSKVVISNAIGKTISTINHYKTQKIQIETEGFYFVNFYNEDNVLIVTKKVVVY